MPTVLPVAAASTANLCSTGLAGTVTGAGPWTVTGVASGICTIFADQAGNATYSAATRATLSFSVTGGPQITPIPSATIVPKVGLWNSASEPGSGYQIDLSGTTMIVTTFSYTVDGLPQWYLSVGALANNTFRGTLDKYRGGPCISCGFQAASMVGNDGELVITFTSPTTATLTLPGGRGVPIARFAFGRVPERDDND